MAKNTRSLQASFMASAPALSAPSTVALVSVFSLAFGACAGSELRPAEPTLATANPVAHRSARRATMPTMEPADPAAAPYGAGSNPQRSLLASPTVARAERPQGARFGSPTVAAVTTASQSEPRVQRRNGSLLVECGGNQLVAAPVCPQCPALPDQSAQRRAALSQERQVLACEPPFDSHGLLAVHLTMRAAGAVSRVSFPHNEVSESMAACLGRALCAARTASFREPEARFDYEYVIAR